MSNSNNPHTSFQMLPIGQQMAIQQTRIHGGFEPIRDNDLHLANPVDGEFRSVHTRFDDVCPTATLTRSVDCLPVEPASCFHQAEPIIKPLVETIAEPLRSLRDLEIDFAMQKV